MNSLLLKRNAEILRIAQGVFQYDKKSWNKVKEDLSPDQVKDFYQAYGNIWDINIQPESYLMQSNKLTALYLGDSDVRKLARTINGSLLYSDNTIIIEPFFPVWCIKPDYNPINRPSDYQQDTLSIIYFLKCITPLIESGYVQLFPNPEMYDHELRLSSWNSAEKRIPESGKMSPNFESAFEEEMPDIDKIFIDQFILAPEDWLIRRGQELKLTQKKINSLIKFVRNKRKADPTILIKSNLREMGSQILSQRGGLNLETSLYVSNLTNAYPLTYSKFKWEEFKSVKEKLTEMSYWMEVSKAIQDLPLGFLDTTEGSTLAKLRNEGMVSNFRTLLMQIKNSRDSGEVLTADSVRDIKDQIHSAYLTALEEYKTIDQKLLTGSLGEVGGIITGSLAIDLAKIAPFGLDLLRQLKTASGDRNNFMNTSPMAIFIELSKKKFLGTEYGYKN